MSHDIAVIVGSLRKASFNRMFAKVLIEVAPASLQLSLVEIGALPLYDQDLDDGSAAVPPAWTAFRERMHAAQGVLFVTPEYNRSVPGVLKNAIDVGSRPYGHSVWQGKPAAVASVSIGAIAGFGANHHLRQSLVFLDMPTLQQPEAYIGGADKLFDGNGKLLNEGTRAYAEKFMQAYAAWVERIRHRH
ncbi:MAG: NAD(P)H-dependent oxidoreductase [Dokdonella sp.]|uniref:NADPH-dependent FMN reductase n=1 Tax=Dokdonella sp. TaxID=2291710 RepID=UPI0025C12CC5|nr:NAD(P)H-dependent oxidoreductase [Dokdonella sp.]MBZ0223178.1 NAD(P)H-dependent oxidoreductase [Dokdonella sp.]MCC7255170.1 NAD(P)H-dependent oxidoreductase [Dokdonella sp.]